ncbi:MAG TPA: hypothetical protein VKR53_21800 [Puia sp.]|nr:hypothetical protein [Puia sp.]
MRPPQKIVLIQLYSNGDCLYATAVARQIKSDYPGCHLTWAVASFCKNIIANNPYVDEILEISSVKKDDVKAFRKFTRDVHRGQFHTTFDRVFTTQIAGVNLAFYDGSIRSNIFRAYPSAIKVPVTPVLNLTVAEMDNVKKFAARFELSDYKHVILFEYAPQSGQLNISKEIAVSIAEKLIERTGIAVVLSSGSKVLSMHKQIIDGSILTLRETAALTHYATFLLGCSSGITWVSTSDAAKLLPMVQLLDAEAKWRNSVLTDFTRFDLPADALIEMYEFNEEKIIECVGLALENFSVAKNKFNQVAPLNFKTTRSIIYNLLCYLEFGAILKHIKVNVEIYGNNFSFYKEVLAGFIIFPFRLFSNFIRKQVLKK